MEDNKALNISIKCFVSSLAVIFALMVFTYALTFIIPSGEYQRTVNEAGNVVIDTSKNFTFTDGELPFYKWILSPFLVLGFDGNVILIAVLVFLLIVGGTFECLGKCNFMSYMLNSLASKFGKVRYRFMAILMLFFMLLGALIGSFEEVVPITPIVCALAVSLGWDTITGLAMSLLAVGCGFASGVCNPFTVGIAQRLANVPMFSGVLFRLVSFILIYLLLLLFVRSHAKKVDSFQGKEFQLQTFKKDKNLSKALLSFGIILGTGIAIVISSSFITVLQDYTLIIFALAFLIGGIVASINAKMSGKEILKTFVSGAKTMLPTVLMVLMASSIRYILVMGKIQDTLLYYAINIAKNLSDNVIILFIYLIVLIMNFFVGSGSAKVFMLMPLIIPLATAFGITENLAISAFAFGDGFSNVFYPTNAALLISLSVANIKYTDWVKWSWKFQTANLILTSLILFVGCYLY